MKQRAAPPLLYGFAKSKGVLVEDRDADTPVCLHNFSATITSLVEAQRVSGQLVAFRSCSPEEFEGALSRHYSDDASEAAKAAETSSLLALAENVSVVDDLLDQSNDAPIVRLINAIFLEAIKLNASDIHIEIEEHRLVVRLRVDGKLREVLEPKRDLAGLLVSRIKVIGKLDIAEKRQPQDGRVSLKIGKDELDVRISTIPSQFGERVVLRLLDRGQTKLSVTELGMSNGHVSRFERILSFPDGLVLVTGPTGAGKSTTLYAALHKLNDRSRNIMTVEDPIEYSIDGVGQMQVNAQTGLSFAKGLRAILRQDPDVIMVGEVRDRETARIAVESAMTGHLVLATLHTNSAVGAVSRLTDMGVERYVLAPMLRGLIAQRLVRRICTNCTVPHEVSEVESELLAGEISVGEMVAKGKGCESCQYSGYRGRSAIYEIVSPDKHMENLVHDGASEADIVRAARKHSSGILTDGVAKIRRKLTTVEEVAMVVNETASMVLE